jgi:hypothetical protein
MTAALDLKARSDDVGVFEYACHEDNYGMATCSPRRATSSERPASPLGERPPAMRLYLNSNSDSNGDSSSGRFIPSSK